jgi:hypothetical protein
VIVFSDRQDRARGVAVRGWLEAVGAFEGVPAVVATSLNQVDLFSGVLAYVADPEVTSRAVKRKAPGIAKAVGPYLGSGIASSTGRSGKRIIGRDSVVAIAGRIIDIDSQDRSQQSGRVLTVAVWIATTTAVAEPNVKITVGTESQRSAVVVAERLRDFKDDEFGRSVRDIGIRRNGESAQDRPAGVGCGIVDVEMAVVRVVGVESQAEQAFLVAPVADPGGNVEESRYMIGLRRAGENRYESFLLDNHHPVRSVWRVGEQQGVVAKRSEVKAGECRFG